MELIETGHWGSCCGLPSRAEWAHPRHRSRDWNTSCCTGADECLWNWQTDWWYGGPICDPRTWKGEGGAAIRNALTDEIGDRRERFLSLRDALQRALSLVRKRWSTLLKPGLWDWGWGHPDGWCRPWPRRCRITLGQFFPSGRARRPLWRGGWPKARGSLRAFVLFVCPNSLLPAFHWGLLPIQFVMRR